jgi:two-component system sensor histidine kinase HydH
MDPELTQVAQITWSRQRLIIEAEGACELVLGASADSLIGQSLHRALGISENRARELDQRACESNSTQLDFLSVATGRESELLRLALGRRHGNASAGISNLRHFLAGAPPVQISALASSLSHEIRNPLSSVKMAVQTLARNTSLSERDRRRLAIANREIRTMERMLWLFSEYGREVPPALESVPLRTLVQEAAALVEPELAERRIEVRIEGDAAARAQMEAGRVARVLSQLLLNIATGQPEGSVLKIEIRPALSEGFEMRILDPAAVGEPKDAASVFEPFSSMLSRGAGLALAALSRVMESHGGKLSADWSSGRGTLYTLSFPG